MHIHERTTVTEIMGEMPANAHLSLVREGGGMWIAEVGSIRGVGTFVVPRGVRRTLGVHRVADDVFSVLPFR